MAPAHPRPNRSRPHGRPWPASPASLLADTQARPGARPHLLAIPLDTTGAGPVTDPREVRTAPQSP